MSGTPHTDGSLPPHLVERVWAYFAAFLPPAAIDGAVDEATADADFWGDTDDVQVLHAAHNVLSSRMRVAADVETLVLVEDVGLDVDQTARVLELPPARVQEMLDEAMALLADPEALDVPAAETPAPPAPSRPDEPEPRLADRIGIERELDAPAPEAPAAAPATPPVERVRSSARPTEPVSHTSDVPFLEEADERRLPVRALAIGAGIVAVVVVLILLLGGGGGGGATAGGDCVETAPVCVTEAVLTDSVDGLGLPGQPRDTFSLGEDVKLWMRFERQVDGPIQLDVSWSHDGSRLYVTDFALASADHIALPLAKIFMEEPGSYEVQVLAGDTVLVERQFQVEG